jgi:cyclopropane fatty-acyl-phospholipid synthase-like methyltransferase
VKPHDVRDEWADRSGEYSPAYYAYYGPDETSEWVRERLAARLDPADPVMEVGCSSGRHLAHLHDHGFERLVGVELNPEAFDVMADTYPDLHDAGTFHEAAIEDVVGEFETDQFGATISVETLQHVHPDATWVFEELARVTADLLVVVENEGDEAGGVNYVHDDVPLFYRDWATVFGDLGWEVAARDHGERDTRLALRPE